MDMLKLIFGPSLKRENRELREKLGVYMQFVEECDQEIRKLASLCAGLEGKKREQAAHIAFIERARKFENESHAGQREEWTRKLSTERDIHKRECGALIARVRELETTALESKLLADELKKEGPLKQARDERDRLMARCAELDRQLKELVESQRALDADDCVSFSSETSNAGMDEGGCWQLGTDGELHDADPRFVISVAGERVRELESMVEKFSKANKALSDKVSEGDMAIARVKELEAELAKRSMNNDELFAAVVSDIMHDLCNGGGEQDVHDHVRWLYESLQSNAVVCAEGNGDAADGTPTP